MEVSSRQKNTVSQRRVGEREIIAEFICNDLAFSNYSKL